MERQLDGPAAEREIPVERKGIRVLSDANTARLMARPASRGSNCPTDADRRRCGVSRRHPAEYRVGEGRRHSVIAHRGRHCLQTGAPDIFALGECADIVASVTAGSNRSYEQARVLARHSQGVRLPTAAASLPPIEGLRRHVFRRGTSWARMEAKPSSHDVRHGT